MKLNEDLKNEFGQVMDTYGDLYSELMLERYEEGFKMGLRLAFEAFDDPETDFDDKNPAALRIESGGNAQKIL